ncbi:MAG: SDR family NAD(P)-dependent oxidoreductase [Dehalococcoidia bacterium]|nr:SDR family NAD(P)-dependent oxidoreductase [Dehalococcoidia bacterium]
MDPRGKVALVTGAGYGIGRGIARTLAAAGATVIVDDIHDEHGRETVAMIEEAGGKAAYVHADVVQENDVVRMIAFAEETFGGLDILVNNAANEIEPPFYPYASPDRWRRTLEVCLVGVMAATQQAIKPMSERGGGAIVNLSSMAGVGFYPHDSPEYAAAKAGIMRLTATLAPLKQRLNIRVNCIAPNWVATEKVRAFVPQLSEEQRAAWFCPSIEDMARPEDIADAVMHLLRDDSLAGRVMLCDERDSRWLIPVNTDFFSLAERLQ